MTLSGTIALIALPWLMVQPVAAQDLVQEKIVTLSAKAQINKLAHLEFDQENKTYELFFVTKAKKDYAKLETYLIDKDFNLVKSDASEVMLKDLTGKYKWWKYTGETDVIEGLFIDPKDNLVLKKKQLTGEFNWLTLSYVYKTKVLQKVKMRNEEGEKYFLIKYYLDDKTGGAYVLAGVRDKSDKNRQWTDIHFLKINKDLDVEKKLSLDLKNPVNVMGNKVLEDSEGGLENWLFLMQDKDNSGKSLFLNISSDCQVVDRIEFEVRDPSWTVEDILYHAGSGAVCVFGPSGKGAFQNLKFADQKLVYNTITPFTEFKEKFRKPSSQKKGDPYSGKTFSIGGADFLDDGTLLIMGQNWDMGGASNVMSMVGGSGDISARYMDSFLFHFDPEGKFIGQYCYYTKDKGWSNDYPNSQLILRGTSGKHFYWLVMPVDQFGFTHHPSMICKIDKEQSTMEEFKIINDFGKEKGIFFHNYDYPWFDAGDGKIVFFGSVLGSPASYKTNKVWFSEFRLD